MCMINDPDELNIIMNKQQGIVMDTVFEVLMPLPKTGPFAPKAKSQRKPLTVDVEIQLVLNGKHKACWMVADIFGTIAGSDEKETRDQPAEHRCIEDMEVIVNGCDIYDALPSEIIEQIEDSILEGDC